LDGIQVARTEIQESKALLHKAERIIQEIERRKFISQYPDWPAAKYLSYADAKAIRQLNEQEGRILKPSEIQGTYKQIKEKLDYLQQQLTDLNKTESRLNGAAQWLEKYERYAKEARKWPGLTKAAKDRHAESVAGMKQAEGMMKHFGVTDRGDYGRQLQQHQQAVGSKPALERSIEAIRPTFNVISNALHAIQHANGARSQEQAREEWARRQAQRGIMRQQEHDHDMGR
jgi:hypothetical protein